MTGEKYPVRVKSQLNLATEETEQIKRQIWRQKELM